MSANLTKPYSGDQPYIFISYSHRNMDEMTEIIETLMKNGFRVWYDEGIDPGTEWDENIATHVNRCSYFISLISEAYLKSENCRDELNYARDCDKPRLLVYLEDVPLPAGMQMRLGRLQAIHKYRYPNNSDFYNKLMLTDGIEVCLDQSRVKSGTDDFGIAETNPSDPSENVMLYDIRLISAGKKTSDKVEIIKIVRRAAGLGIKEGKRLVDSAPCLIAQRLDLASALELKSLIEKQNGTVEMISLDEN